MPSSARIHNVRSPLSLGAHLTFATQDAHTILQGIHVMRIVTQAEMIAFWHTLEDWLVAHPKVRLSATTRPTLISHSSSLPPQVKLICIDTLSFFFRNPSLDHPTKKRILEMSVPPTLPASPTLG